MINLRLLFAMVSVLCFLFSAIGCDAFVRKFTRKPKKDKMEKEEMVLEPEVYKPSQDKEGIYRQYLTFWKSWQDELIEALNYSRNHKKQVDCAQQALKNLVYIHGMLKPAMQKKLDIYIKKTQDLRDQIAGDAYGSSVMTYHSTAERLRMKILNDFSYDKVKGSLK